MTLNRIGARRGFVARGVRMPSSGVVSWTVVGAEGRVIESTSTFSAGRRAHAANSPNSTTDTPIPPQAARRGGRRRR